MIDVREEHKSREITRGGDSATLKQIFKIIGAPNVDEAEQAIRNYPFPSEDFDALEWEYSKKSYEVAYIFFDKNNPDNNVFEATRTYALSKDDPDDDGIEWRLSMSTSAVTCTSAKKAIMAEGSYPFWDVAENEYGEGSPINVRKVNGAQETGGVDIAVPTLKLTLGFECTKNQWKSLRPKLLKIQRGTTNKLPFQGFEAGELLFTGFDSTRLENGERYQLSYTFDVSPNSDFKTGNFEIKKAKGFSVKWCYFGAEEEIESEDGKIIRPKCTGIYASEIYEEADFNEYIPNSVNL